MKTRLNDGLAGVRGARLSLTIAAVAVLFSATAEADHGAARLAQHLERALTSNPKTFQFTNIRDLQAGGIPAAGAGYLIRSKNALSAHVIAADLEPGHAYTFWWVIFNKPQRCAQSPCTLADRTAAGGATLYASGAVASVGGTNVSFSTDSGGPPEGVSFNAALPSAGLMTDHGFRAEVHIILVDHGVPSFVPDFQDEAVDGTWGFELTTPEPFGSKWVRGLIFQP